VKAGLDVPVVLDVEVTQIAGNILLGEATQSSECSQLVGVGCEQLPAPP
jgi:hypothetical protein